MKDNFPVKGQKTSNSEQIQDTVKSRTGLRNKRLFWIIQDGCILVIPKSQRQRNPKWPAKLMHPNDSYLRASVKTVRVVGRDAETGLSAVHALGYNTNQDSNR